jgi:hypothetical protein
MKVFALTTLLTVVIASSALAVASPGPDPSMPDYKILTSTTRNGLTLGLTDMSAPECGENTGLAVLVSPMNPTTKMTPAPLLACFGVIKAEGVRFVLVFPPGSEDEGVLVAGSEFKPDLVTALDLVE